MKKPDRIDAFCDLLKILWKQKPDLRFGQIIEGIKTQNQIEDLFYTPDDEFKKLLSYFFNNSK